MFRKSTSQIVALATLVLALSATTAAEAQSNRRNDDDQAPQSRPRVSPAEARDRARQSGQPIDIRPRRDGNYGVLVENGGRVREVVVDGQTGRVRQGGQNNNSGDSDTPPPQRPRRPN